ncbi:MAG: ZIP family metal transporter [Acidobacteria bacterium]|nr:ZIP family metal transporter [Acidobacteriota bacterium]
MPPAETAALTPAQQAFLASLLAGLATGLGGFLVVLVPRLPRRVYDTLLGFSGGVMLSAAALTLLWPALERGGIVAVALGLFSGGLTIWLLERTVPHLEPHFAPRLNRPGARVGLLLAVAITLHNLPEGLAVGVAYAPGAGSFGAIIALAIALQNIPEGLAVATPLRAQGAPWTTAVGWATASGLAEPVAAAAGFHFVNVLSGLVPFGLAFAAGAMVFVVSDQLIPESHREPSDKAPSLALLSGFLLVALLVRLSG